MLWSKVHRRENNFLPSYAMRTNYERGPSKGDQVLFKLKSNLVGHECTKLEVFLAIKIVATVNDKGRRRCKRGSSSFSGMFTRVLLYRLVNVFPE